MKPENWNRMKSDEKVSAAKSLLASTRGSYLLGQALAVAAFVLKNGEHPHREVSNAEDMEMIGTLFEPFYSMEVQSDRFYRPEEEER